MVPTSPQRRCRSSSRATGRQWTHLQQNLLLVVQSSRWTYPLQAIPGPWALQPLNGGPVGKELPMWNNFDACRRADRKVFAKASSESFVVSKSGSPPALRLDLQTILRAATRRCGRFALPIIMGTWKCWKQHWWRSSTCLDFGARTMSRLVTVT